MNKLWAINDAHLSKPSGLSQLSKVQAHPPRHTHDAHVRFVCVCFGSKLA